MEQLSDLSDVLLLAPKRKGRGSRRHLEAGQMGQRVHNLFREAVAEILVVRVAAHIGKRQHRYRGLPLGRQG